MNLKSLTLFGIFILLTTLGQISAAAPPLVTMKPSPTTLVQKGNRFRAALLEAASSNSSTVSQKIPNQPMKVIHEKTNALTIKASEKKAQGGGSDGGGFRYYYTSGTYFRNIKNYIAQALVDGPSAQELETLSDKYKVNFDWSEFATIVKNGHSAPMKNLSRKNPDGYEEPLIMNYDSNSRSIEALAPFFEIFDKEQLSDKETFEMMRLVLHETSHVFGLGTANDDELARKFSFDLLKIVSRYWYRCGQADSNKLTKLNIAQCDYKKVAPANETQKLIVTSKPAVEGGACTVKVRAFSIFSMILKNTEMQYPLKPEAESTSDTAKVVYDLRSMEPGAHIVVISNCFNPWFAKGGSGSVEVSDENKDSLKVRRSYEQTEEINSVRFDFVKTDNGKLLPLQN